MYIINNFKIQFLQQWPSTHLYLGTDTPNRKRVSTGPRYWAEGKHIHTHGPDTWAVGSERGLGPGRRVKPPSGQQPLCSSGSGSFLYFSRDGGCAVCLCSTDWRAAKRRNQQNQWRVLPRLHRPSWPTALQPRPPLQTEAHPPSCDLSRRTSVPRLGHLKSFSCILPHLILVAGAKPCLTKH